MFENEEFMKYCLLLIIVFGILYYIASVIATYIKLKSRKNIQGKNTSSFHPPISILKPVKGFDKNLYKNMLSFIKQNYPQFEIIFGVQSEYDSAIHTLRRIINKFPEKNMKIVVTKEDIGYNPKINNLAGIYAQAKYEYILISDCNVRVKKNFLSENINYIKDEKVGLVNNLIRGVKGNNPGAVLENLHLNSFILRNVSLTDTLLNHKIVIGKSILFRKSQFEKLGGLDKLKNYLAEDYLMGRLYTRNDYKVIISPLFVDTVNRSRTYMNFVNRYTRWSRLRYKINPFSYIGELIVNFSFWAFILGISKVTNEESLLLPTCFLSIKIVGDMFINLWLGSPLKPFLFFLSPIKDLIVATIWICPLISSKTKWRGNKLKITKDSLLIPAK